MTTEAATVSFSEKYQLTRREEEILEFFVFGKTNKEIADNLFLSESTVRFHVSNILKKTGYKNRNEVKKAFKHLQINE
ncbi:MAG: response regulator transcription factor [Firmicutes bacterium]|nr:response regulator transcription factor [Bacillota bacterium]